MGVGKLTVIRELTFELESQAISFCTELGELCELVQQRANSKVAKLGLAQRTSLTSGNDISILIEIVSATNLPIADRHSTDPFVNVWHGATKIHRTKHLNSSLNPIWTLYTGALCLFQTTADDFFQTTYGLTFIVKDYDTAVENDDVAQVALTHEEILNATGKRTEYDLKVLIPQHKLKISPTNLQHPGRPKLTLRIRKATESDIAFMQSFQQTKYKTRGIYADVAFVAPHSHRVNRLRRETKRGDIPGQLLVRSVVQLSDESHSHR